MVNANNLTSKTRSIGAMIIGGILITTTLSTAAMSARPRDLDRSLDRLSDNGVFRIKIESRMSPIRTSKLHQWSVNLTGANGEPVNGATFKIDGGMPQHRHGLPTAPRVDLAGTVGEYVINGMKFSMTGWWVIKLDVSAPDGRSDNITFNVVL